MVDGGGAGPARLAVLRRAAALSARKTLADINIDGVNQWGRTKDITVIGMGASDLDDYLREAAAANRGARCGPTRSQRRASTTARIISTSRSRACPRSIRIPASTSSASPRSTASRSATSTPSKDYHAPSDEMKPDWDLTGAVDDAQLLFAVGYRVANADKFPEWKPGNEFKAKRDAMLKK